MRIWIVRYVGYLAALAGAGVALSVVCAGLMIPTFDYLDVAEENWPDWHLIVASKHGISPVLLWVLGSSAFLAAGLLPAAIVYRWIGIIGWKKRSTPMHTLFGALLVLCCVQAIGLARVQGLVSLQQIQIAHLAVFLILGFAWHLFTQTRAQERVREATINAFA